MCVDLYAVLSLSILQAGGDDAGHFQFVVSLASCIVSPRHRKDAQELFVEHIKERSLSEDSLREKYGSHVDQGFQMVFCRAAPWVPLKGEENRQSFRDPTHTSNRTSSLIRLLQFRLLGKI